MLGGQSCVSGEIIGVAVSLSTKVKAGQVLWGSRIIRIEAVFTIDWKNSLISDLLRFPKRTFLQVLPMTFI